MSGRVDFHVLSRAAPDARLRCACQLAEHAVGEGSKVYLLTANAAQTQRLDELLWTFSDGVFLPHEVFTGAPASHSRVHVLLGDSTPPPSHRDVLINLTETLPPDLDGYPRIIEIVDVDPELKKSARERFRQYRERGWMLESHNL